MLIVVSLPLQGTQLGLALRDLLNSLGDVWARELAARPLPPLYQAGVRFAHEPSVGSGVEEWADPYSVARRRWGDCDDLVLWRLGELRAAGEPASAQIVRRRGTNQFHARVRRSFGVEEDPSALLLR